MKRTITYFTAILAGISWLSGSAQISNYCPSNATSQFDTKIDSVVLNTISAGSAVTSCETYTDNTAMSTTLSPGQQYTIRVINGSCGGYYGGQVRAWIDFDQNGTFDDPAERIIDASASGLQSVLTNTFTVPAAAIPGSTYMRVALWESGIPQSCGTYTYGETEDYSIEIQSPVENDAGVNAILEPNTACEGKYLVKARVNNYGSNQITTVKVDWEIDGILQQQYTINSTLDTVGGLGSNFINIMLDSVTLTPGTPVQIKAWTTMPNSVVDSVNINDTVNETYNVIPTISTFPYIEDFESGRADWVMGGVNSTWAFGTPAKANITGAASGDSAWVTGGLTGNYNNNENSNVTSPCFDLSGYEGMPWVALDVNWYSENSWDGANLQVSTNGGQSWSLVGAEDDPYNWYNDGTINGNPGGSQEGWTGSGTNGSNGWLRAKHELNQNVTKNGVRFRINFGSDGSVNSYEGFAFDNFIVAEFKEANLGDDIQSFCGNASKTLDPNVNFRGTIEWSNGDTINETILVSDTGIYWVIYTDSLLDLSTGDTMRIIQTAPPSIDFAKSRDTINVNQSITLDPGTAFNLNYHWQEANVNFPYLLLYGQDLGIGEHPQTLTITDSLDCQDTETVTVVVTPDFTGIEEYATASIKYYPNPVRDMLNIELSGFENKPITVQIMDLQGRVVERATVQQANDQTISLDVSALTKGAYLMRLQSESQSAVARIVVE